MAKGFIQFDVKLKYSNRMTQLLRFLRSRDVRQNVVNQQIADAIDPYVPYKSGALAKSVNVTPDYIRWGEGLPYAHYQHEGIVYGPNIPGLINGQGAFRSPHKKYPTGRPLGGELQWDTVYPIFVRDASGTRKANASDPPFPWVFGHSTPGTTSKWTLLYERDLKADTNRKITYELKKLCRAKGWNT